MVKSMSLIRNSNSNMQEIQKQGFCSVQLNSKEITQKKEARRIRKRQELRSLYSKLKEVIPSCPTEPLSSLDIVLHAVDYINELHQTLLEEYPGLPTPIPNLTSSTRSSDSTSSTLSDVTNNDRVNRSFRDVTNVTSSFSKITEKLRN